MKFSAGSRPYGIFLDATDANSIDGSDVNIPLVSPLRTPRISNNIVLLAAACAITDNCNGVIDGGSAISGVDDSSLVVHKDGVVCLNIRGNRSLGDGSLKISNRTGLDPIDSLDVNLSSRGVVLAGLSYTFVCINSFKLLAMILNIAVSVVLQTTTATLRSSVTINNLLLREIQESSSLDFMVSLNSGCCSECPA